MELTLLGFAIFAAVPVLLGSSILRAIGIGFATDRVAYAGWVWLTGALAVGGLETLRLLTGLSSPGAPVVLAVVVSAVLRYRARATPIVGGAELDARPCSKVERAFFVAVLALVLAATVQRILVASLSAVIANDEATFWAMRAKFLFDGGQFSGVYAQAITNAEFNNASYPLLNPFLQLWVFDCAGTVTHFANRLPIQLCALALLLCAAAAFRRVSRRWIAALLLILLATCSPLEVAVRRANSDVLVALAVLVAADALSRGLRANHGAWLGLGSLAVTFLLWSKREGMLHLAAAALAFALVAWHRRNLRRPLGPPGSSPALPVFVPPMTGKPDDPEPGWSPAVPGMPVVSRRAVPWLLLPLVVQLGTMFHNAWFHAEGSYRLAVSSLVRTLERLDDNILDVLSYFVGLLWKDSLLAIPGAFVLLALFVRPPPRAAALAFVPLASLFFVLVIVLAFVWGEPDKLLPNACVRVVFQLVPLQMLWLASVAWELFGYGRDARAREPAAA